MAERRIKTVVVDDSTAVRSMVTGWVKNAPSLDLVGEAADGESALRVCRIYNPDVVLLDVEMPGMSGLEVLKQLMKSDPTRVVIMFSALTREGASSTIEALASGAADYLTKPSSMGGGRAGLDETREQLIEKATVLGERRRQTRSTPRFAAPSFLVPGASKPAPSEHPRPRLQSMGVRTPSVEASTSRPLHRPEVPKNRPAKAGRVEAVVIASSTGGPAALTEIVPKLSKSLPVPILLVQHMPALFTEMLAERLNLKSEITVKIAEDNEAVQPSTLYVAPGGIHLEVFHDSGRVLRCRLVDAAPELSCKPSANYLFRSASRCFGSNLLGVVLTGMGQDGCAGSEELVSHGGSVIVQDEASSVVWGMPGAVTHLGIQEGVYPLTDIAEEINRRAGGASRVRRSEAARPEVGVASLREVPR
ncbi:MAG: protein-glutamate methylesterase/protein-glutamine glutaminase [Acidimicrobiales bacterium]